MLSSFLFNDTASTEIYTLSLHDALPICASPFFHQCSHFLELGAWTKAVDSVNICCCCCWWCLTCCGIFKRKGQPCFLDRKSTRLNSSHANISYAVFCLKKKVTINLW